MDANKIYNKVHDMEALERNLPEKADIEVLRSYSDVILLRGLVEMGKIITSPESERTEEKDGNVIKVMDPSNKIKAFNAVVGLGRYIEERNQHELADREFLDLSGSEIKLDEDEQETGEI